MYDTLANLIQYGEYTLSEITERIDTMYAECRITAEQRADLQRMAAEYADPERERPEILSMLEGLAARVTALEARMDAGEGKTPDPDEIPAWQPWDGLSALYAKGDRVSHGGKTWVSLVNNNCWEPGIIGTELVWREVMPDE